NKHIRTSIPYTSPFRSNGLMDIERNPRVFHDVFAQINADTVIVPRPERYAAYAGDTLSVEVTIATGGRALPDGATLRWSGDAAGDRKSTRLNSSHVKIS